MPSNSNMPLPIDKTQALTSEFSILFKEMVSDGINLFWLLNKTGKIVYMNSTAITYLKDEFDIEISEGMILDECIPEKIGDQIKSFISANPNPKKELQTPLMLNNRILHLSVSSVSNLNLAQGFAVNMYCHSGLAEKVETLQTKLQFSKFITDHLFDVVWTQDINFNLIFVSKSIYNQRGFTSDEYAKLSLEETMTPASVQFAKKLISSVNLKQHTAENPIVYTAEYYKKDGSTMFGESIAFSISENGKIKSIYGVTRDVTDRIKNLRKINEQKSELQTVLNNTDEMIASIDLEYKIVTMNEANKARIKQRIGKDPKIGDPILDYVQPDNVGELKKLFKQIINRKRSGFQHIFTTNYENRDEYFETSLKPIILDNDEVIGISVFVKDITAAIITQQTLEESESRLLRITDTTLEGIWEYNIDSNTLYLSERLKKITGYRGKNDLEEFKTYIKTVIDKDNYEKYKHQIINQTSVGKSFGFEILINTLENNELWLQVKAFVSNNLKGEPVLISGLMLDITDRKLQETALRIAKESAEEMNRLKSSFIANMSHEVRTPLNGMLGVSQLLEEMDIPEDVKYYLRLQKESGFRLLDTINNIMSLSRLEAKTNQQELKPLDLNNYIRNQLEPFEIMAKQKNIELEFIPGKDVIMLPLNEHLFYQVFNNLVGNAIKFTPKGLIKIYTDSDDTFARFTVVDTGVGIKKENKDSIFEAFVQESTGTDRKFEGSGLGLAIVKKYVEWSGGTISVESKKGVGSIFTLNLPLSKQNNH